MIADFFRTNGFAVVRGLFRPDELADPLQALAAWHDRRAAGPGSALEVHEQAAEAYEQPFWNPLVERVRPITAAILGHTPLEIGRQLIGSRNDPPVATPYSHPHIDSVTHALSQAADGGDPVFPRFEVLAGVYLTDATGDETSGLWVWPGSHRLADAALGKSGTVRERLTGLWNAVEPQLREPLCLRGSAGDVLLVHPLLTHASGRNPGPHLAGRLYLRFAGTATVGTTSALPDKVRECVLRRERSIFTLNESATGTSLLKRYARFKLGDVTVRDEWLTRLAAFVARALDPPASPDEWAVATASTNDLAHDFTAKLGRAWNLDRPLAVLDVSTPATPVTDYTDRSLAERAAIARGFFADIGPIRQRSVIVVDDMITTGTALGTLVQFLAARGIDPAAVYPFALVRSYFAEPGRERALVDTEIARITPEEIADIFNHPGHYSTSGTMWRHLAGSGAARRQVVFRLLRRDRSDRLRAEAVNFLGDLAEPLLADLREAGHAG